MRLPSVDKERLLNVPHASGLLGLWRRAALPADVALKRLGLTPRLQRGALILLFHRIADDADSFHHCMPVALFDALCAHLRRHYQVVPLDELVTAVGQGRLPAGMVALTFDDGYADSYRLALPVRRRHGLPATVFITTGAIGHQQPLWFSRLAAMLSQTAQSTVPPSRGVALGLTSTTERIATYCELSEHLKRLGSHEREAWLQELSDLLGVKDFSGLRDEMVTWDELREMDAAGFRAGAHTVSHPILSHCTEDELREELTTSKAQLERELGRAVDLFAYPNGRSDDFNAAVVAAVAAAGYRAACTTVFGANGPLEHPYRLRRVILYGATLPPLALQLERFFYTTHRR
ncbi:MAG: polysaccharide deacetylase family protein [Proteobacteria bacterium]|nr:polysaccharide deacetylase family protein [Pseudomonadota bacterium]